MPKSLLSLQLLLSENAPDLADLATTIRNDIGLSLALLSLAATELDGCSDQILAVTDLIVLAGLQRIRSMVATCPTPPFSLKDHSRLAAFERFCMHSRLTAHVAEELAVQTSDVTMEEAFFAGLFYQLSAVPLHLGWDMATPPTRDLNELVYELATDWNLPPTLADVIRGHRPFCRSNKARVLLALAGVASTWAYRLEFLAARESETVRAKNPPYSLKLP